jgi:hypothetical protein
MALDLVRRVLASTIAPKAERGDSKHLPFRDFEVVKPKASSALCSGFCEFESKGSATQRGKLSTADAGSVCFVPRPIGYSRKYSGSSFLLSKANKSRQIPLVIAGSRIPDSLRKTILLQEDCHLVDTPSPSEMQRWIQHAAVHCIPCYGMAGLRLKIIHAMMGDGHVLVSREGVQGMPWAAWLTVVASEHDWEDQVRKALEKPLQADEVAARHAWVLQHFDQRANALKILDLMGVMTS